MRFLSTAGLLLTAVCSALAQQLRINELQAFGTDGDRVEVYNAGSRAAELQGCTFSIGEAHATVVNGMRVAPHGFMLLHFDGRIGEVHMRLPREGGTLLLIAADGSTILDAFTYSQLPSGASVGRAPDGGRSWGYFTTPTFGSANGTPAAHRILRTPVISCITGASPREVSITASDGAQCFYTRDGSIPSPTHGQEYFAPFTVDEPTVIRAITLAPDALPGTIATRTVCTDDDTFLTIALTVDPADLWDADKGIDTEGEHANFSRTGLAWERSAALELPGDSVARPVGVRISGSGSRSLPKRSFKVLSRERFGSAGTIPFAQGAGYHELLLRADATPDAFLRNSFMEAVVRESGSRVDVQPSTPVRLLLNGRDHGLYRAMPPKDAEWLRSLSSAEAVDVIDGPGGIVLNGNDAHYDAAISALGRGAPLDTLGMLIDLDALIDLACFDLYTGRADHDLNVRCWRPRTAEGKLRWVLFDMDLWAPAQEGTVERMTSSLSPEAPYIPQLLAQPQLRNRLLARSEALLATVLSPEHAAYRADSIISANGKMLADDRARWSSEMEVPASEESLADMHAFTSERPKALLDQLGHHVHADLRTIAVRVQPAGSGEVLVEDLPLTDRTANMQAFGGVTVRFTAVPRDGMEFEGFSGAGSMVDTIIIDPAKERSVKAVFRKIGERSGGHGL